MIPRDINEAARDRKKIERLFGEAKRNLAFARLRLRGLGVAKDEFLLTATVQYLRRLVKLVSRPPPRQMMARSMRKNDNRTGKKCKTRPGIRRNREKKLASIEVDIENGFWPEFCNTPGHKRKFRGPWPA